MTLKTQKGTATTLAGVILGFSALSGANLQFLPPKRYDEHFRHLLGEFPPAPGAKLPWPFVWNSVLFDKQTDDLWLTEIFEDFQRVLWFRKSRIKENGGNSF